MLVVNRTEKYIDVIVKTNEIGKRDRGMDGYVVDRVVGEIRKLLKQKGYNINNEGNPNFVLFIGDVVIARIYLFYFVGFDGESLGKSFLKAAELYEYKYINVDKSYKFIGSSFVVISANNIEEFKCITNKILYTEIYIVKYKGKYKLIWEYLQDEPLHIYREFFDTKIVSWVDMMHMLEYGEVITKDALDIINRFY